MKVITKLVELENEKFVLIKDEQNGRKFYGTIPYSELDERGCLKRPLNGFEMCVSFLNIADAIEQRNKQILVDRYKAKGHTKAEVMMFVASGYTEENWDMDMFDRIKAIA